jgi:5-(carboxyamino)imidazole ribonucleotide synthase
MAVTSKPLCVGILGGGQLARMSAQAAHRLGMEVVILEKELNSPAAQVTQHSLQGWIEDDHLLEEMARQCDVITLENEFVDFRRLEFLEQLGKRVIPGSATIGLIQDKLLQKQTLAKHGIPVPRFLAVDSKSDFSLLSQQLSVPFVLKSRIMGYDGYGNVLVKTENDFITAYQRLTSRHANLYAEEFIDFEMELATSIVRTSKELRTYPIVETIQRGHICHTVIAPAQISLAIFEQTSTIARNTVLAIEGYGIFGIELFLRKDGTVLVNEITPRTHNACHYSIEGCQTSQFENHIRAIFDFPLGSTELVRPYTVMINILAKSGGTGTFRQYHEVFSADDVHLHLYGKGEAKVGRKMGHLTVVGDDLRTILKRVSTIEDHIDL